MVRSERPEDYDAARAVNERAFGDGSPEGALVDALRADGAHVPELCLVAVDGDAVVGHILFSRARLAYYPRFGFEPAAGYGVEAPWTVPPEAWMVLPLPPYEPAARGVVTYAQAFAAVE